MTQTQHRVPRSVKLYIWAASFLLVALIAANITMNDGGWPWVIVLLSAVVGFIGFFLWGAKVDRRG